MNAIYGREEGDPLIQACMIHHPMGHPPEALVVKLLMAKNGKVDLVRMFQLSRAAG
jgi:hypothetical protein